MIDWSRVNELRDEIGADEFEEVVDLFLEEVEEVVTRLRVAPSPAHYEEDLHFLKGSALNLGFSAFGQICQAGESASSAGQPEQVSMEQVLACYDQSKTAFLSGLRDALIA